MRDWDHSRPADDEVYPTQDEITAALVEACRSLPEGEVVRWHDTPLVDGMYVAPVEVWAEPLCDMIEMISAWGIYDVISKSEYEEGGELAIQLPPDGYVTEVDGRCCTAWLPETIGNAIETWVTERTGRTDLQFVCDTTLLTGTAELILLGKAFFRMLEKAGIPPEIYFRRSERRGPLDREFPSDSRWSTAPTDTRDKAGLRYFIWTRTTARRQRKPGAP